MHKATRRIDAMSEATSRESAGPVGKGVPTIEPVDESYQTAGDITAAKPVMKARDVNVFYSDNHALQNINLDIGLNEVIALIGPSGCGKSTFWTAKIFMIVGWMSLCCVHGWVSSSKSRTLFLNRFTIT